MAQVLVLIMAASCQGGGSSRDAGPMEDTIDASTVPVDAAQEPLPDAQEVSGDCPAEYLGSGDGCDCGCGVVDPDCPQPYDAEDCAFEHCPEGTQVNAADPSLCIAVVLPVGWTCPAYYYGDDASCTCGCGAHDDLDCPTGADIGDCSVSYDGCPSGQAPSPQAPSQCSAEPAGFTCHWSDYYDDDCSCGCGVADPGCPANAVLLDCQVDGCPSGQSPDPTDVTQCMSEAPQDDWTCDLALLFDGSQCDCGCGALDPDCPIGADASDCDEIHCSADDELKSGDISQCWEQCAPLGITVGSATCTNGGSVSIGNACVRNLSACSDGHEYEVECSGGQCVCRVDGQCVAHATGSCSLNFTCGWSLIDDT